MLGERDVKINIKKKMGDVRFIEGDNKFLEKRKEWNIWIYLTERDIKIKYDTKEMDINFLVKGDKVIFLNEM